MNSKAARRGRQAVAETIAAARHDRGLTRRDFAERLGSRITWVQALENEHKTNRGVLTITRTAYVLDLAAAVFAHAFATGTVQPIPPRTAVPLRLFPLDPAQAAVRMGVVMRRARSGPVRVLAATTGLHRNYHGSLERGTIENPNLQTLYRVSRGLAPQAPALLLSILVAAYAGEVDPRAVHLPTPPPPRGAPGA